MLVAGIALGPLWWWARIPVTAGQSPHIRYTADARVDAMRQAVTLIPPDATSPMAQQIPGAELAVIEGAGHLSNLEAPGEFDELLARHVERCLAG